MTVDYFSLLSTKRNSFYKKQSCRNISLGTNWHRPLLIECIFAFVTRQGRLEKAKSDKPDITRAPQKAAANRPVTVAPIIYVSNTGRRPALTFFMSQRCTNEFGRCVFNFADNSVLGVGSEGDRECLRHATYCVYNRAIDLPLLYTNTRTHTHMHPAKRTHTYTHRKE